MTDNLKAVCDKITRLESKLDGLAASTHSIADRVDILTQECQRTAAQVQRIGLNLEAAKLARQKRDQSLSALADTIAALKSSLENKSG